MMRVVSIVGTTMALLLFAACTGSGTVPSVAAPDSGELNPQEKATAATASHVLTANDMADIVKLDGQPTSDAVTTFARIIAEHPSVSPEYLAQELDSQYYIRCTSSCSIQKKDESDETE